MGEERQQKARFQMALHSCPSVLLSSSTIFMNPFFIFFDNLRDLYSFFWLCLFSTPRIGALFLFERCSTALPCAVKHRVQVEMLAFTVVHNASQHRGRSPYTLQSFFSSKNIVWWRIKKFLAKNLDISIIRLIFAALMSKR